MSTGTEHRDYSTAEKKFFAITAKTAAETSDTDPGRGAILVDAGRIAAVGRNTQLGSKESSAIIDALTHGRGDSLFLSYFPSSSDIIAIITAGVDSFYFLGEINDPDAVELANSFPEAGIDLRIVQLTV